MVVKMVLPANLNDTLLIFLFILPLKKHAVCLNHLVRLSIYLCHITVVPESLILLFFNT